MSLQWVRLDTQWGQNPKVLTLIEQKGHAALVAGVHGTAGYIPTAALPFVHANKRLAAQLVEAGLWQETVGGYQVNDWDEYQKSGEEAISRRDKAQRAALARWHPEQYIQQNGVKNAL